MERKIFFIVGAQSSGTTYLYTLLDQHPEVCMAKPLRPEPKYFLNKNISSEEYFNIFYTNCNSNTKILGEKSTSYYESSEVAKKISYLFPNAKIIFILSNPVYRAISNYKFSVENGFESRSPEEVFLEDNTVNSTTHKTSVNPFNYLGRGEYCKFIKKYYQYFPKKNVYIIIKEEFVNNIENIKKLYKFLDISTDFSPTSIDKVVNKSKISVNISSEIEQKLNNYFKPYNEKLRELLGRKEEIWK